MQSTSTYQAPAIPPAGHLLFTPPPTDDPLPEFYQSPEVYAGMKRALGDLSPSPETVKRACLVTKVKKVDRTAAGHYKRTKGTVSCEEGQVLMSIPLNKSVGHMTRESKSFKHNDEGHILLIGML
jgi:hypothetical protein